MSVMPRRSFRGPKTASDLRRESAHPAKDEIRRPKTESYLVLCRVCTQLNRYEYNFVFFIRPVEETRKKKEERRKRKSTPRDTRDVYEDAALANAALDSELISSRCQRAVTAVED